MNLYKIVDKEIENKIKYWHAGVNAEFWKSKYKVYNEKKIEFLLYIKRPEPFLLEEVKKEIMKNGHNFSEIVYGRYKIESLKEKLNNTDIVIYWVEQESQGLKCGLQISLHGIGILDFGFIKIKNTFQTQRLI